jgi:hypothetical protein
MMNTIGRLVERATLWFRLPGPAPDVPEWPKPHRGASRDRSLPGKARVRSRRST